MVKAWSSSIVLIFSAFAVVGSAPVPQFPNQLNPYGYPGYPPGLPPPFIPPTHPKFPYAPYPYASPYPITPQGYYMPPNPNNPFGVPRSGIVGGANLAAIGFSRGCDLLGEVVKSIFSGAGGLVGSVFSGILGDGALNDASPTINTAPQFIMPYYPYPPPTNTTPPNNTAPVTPPPAPPAPISSSTNQFPNSIPQGTTR